MEFQNICVQTRTLITRPKKGSGIVILDKTFYEEKILKLISDD